MRGTTTEYGYTMDVVAGKGHREVGHRGATPGVSRAVRLYPDDGWSLIILSNYDRVGNIVLMHIEDLIAAAD